MCRFLSRLWAKVRNWLTAPPVKPPVGSPRKVAESEVISGRCWCGDQLTADTGRGWIDAILLHYRERHPDDEGGQKLADDPDRFSTDKRYQPRQW